MRRHKMRHTGGKIYSRQEWGRIYASAMDYLCATYIDSSATLNFVHMGGAQTSIASDLR